MRKAVGIIITISMIMSCCMVAWAADITGNGGEASKDVYGSYKLSGTVDSDGDGMPDTDTKKDTDSDGEDDSYVGDGNSDGILDGDGVADTVPDYAVDGDNDGDGDVDDDDVDKAKEYEDSDEYDDPSAVAPGAATFSVDIAWGNLQYDYVVTGSTWDSNSHTYTGGTKEWKVRGTEDVANAITITNHSNVAIRARYKFDSALKNEDNSPKLTGTFAPSLLKVESAVGKVTADSDVTALSLTGDPGTELQDNTKLGTVTIKIDYTIL